MSQRAQWVLAAVGSLLILTAASSFAGLDVMTPVGVVLAVVLCAGVGLLIDLVADRRRARQSRLGRL